MQRFRSRALIGFLFFALILVLMAGSLANAHTGSNSDVQPVRNEVPRSVDLEGPPELPARSR